MGQYSSFCVSVVVWTLGGVDIEDGVPGREQVECGREEVEDGEKQEKNEHEETTNAQTHNITDDMKMEWNAHWDTFWALARLEPCNEYTHNLDVQSAWEYYVWGVPVYTPRRLQWIAIDC